MKRYYSYLSSEDQTIFFDLGILDYNHDYTSDYAIEDRNDYAVMLSLTAASTVGCRATKQRLMASLPGGIQ